MQQNNDRYYSMMGLLKNEHLSEIFNSNRWHRFDNLRDVLKIMEKSETGEEDKHSIPDVYGRAIQLKITLASAKDKYERKKVLFLSKEIIEWRGILTVLALQHFLGIGIKIKEIKYMNENTAFDKAIKYAPSANMFGGQSEWEQRIFYMVKIKGDEGNWEDIALFSPMTIVYPVADLGIKLPIVKQLKWFDYKERKFLNPTDVLYKTEKMLVCAWLDNLRKQLVSIAHNTNCRNLDTELIDIILFHLDSYKEELQKELSESERIGKNCFDFAVIDEGLKRTNLTVNTILNTTVKVIIAFDNKRKIEYENLFSDQIYYTQVTDSPFVNCSYISKHKIDGVRDWHALIPLGKKIQEICSRNEINDLVNNLEMELVDDGENIKVSVFLSRISDEFIDIEKKYSVRDENEVVQESDFPILAIWPPTNLENWMKYYIYLAGGKSGKIELNGKMEKRSNPYARRVSGFPNAISLMRKSKKEYDIGMLLPIYDEIKRENKANVAATVGIDFGTSGTTVYAKINAENYIFPVITWNDSARLLTKAGKTDERMMSEYFVIQSEEQDMLYSVYRRSSSALLQEVEPVLDGVIYHAHEDEMIEKSKYFMPDIKWDNPNNGVYYKAFIEELCMYIWRQLQNRGVTTIEWKYALPRSMDRKEIFHTMWKQHITKFLKDTISIAHVVDEEEHSESEATSLYFQNASEIKAVNVNKGYLVVDIGGGSTDIAVWQQIENGKGPLMLAQTSIPVAGRHLFTRWVAANIREISEQVSGNESKLKQKLDKLQSVRNVNDSKIMNPVIEKLVNSYNDEIMTSYMQDMAWAKHLKKQLELGVALLFFALGSLIGYLQYNKVIQMQESNGNFCIALGGNGSKILDWVNQKENFLAIFQAGIRSREMQSEWYHPRIIRSKNPKKEVANGLVQERNSNTNQSTTDIKEHITDEKAMLWNRLFKDEYNRLFHRNVQINASDICDMLSNKDRDVDVCFFFMEYMYEKYYREIVRRLR